MLNIDAKLLKNTCKSKDTLIRLYIMTGGLYHRKARLINAYISISVNSKTRNYVIISTDSGKAFDNSTSLDNKRYEDFRNRGH